MDEGRGADDTVRDGFYSANFIDLMGTAVDSLV